MKLEVKKQLIISNKNDIFRYKSLKNYAGSVCWKWQNTKWIHFLRQTHRELFVNWRRDGVKMSVLSELIYRFNVILT